MPNQRDIKVKVIGDNTELDQSLEESKKKLRGFVDETKQVQADAFDRLNETIQSTKLSISDVKQQIKMFNSTGEIAMDGMSSQTRELSFDIGKLSPELQRFQSTIETMTMKNLSKEFVEAEYQFNKLTAQAEDLRHTKADSEMIKPIREELRGVISQLDETGWKLQTIGARMEELNRIKLDNVKDEFKDVGRTANNTLKGIDKGVKRQFRLLRRFAVVLIGLRTFWSLITRSINSYVERNAELKAQIDGLMQGLGQVLAPLAELAVKALQKLVRWLAIAIAYTFTFINAIFGTNLAITTSAKSMKRLTDQTKKAVQASNKLLAPFDELNILTEDTGVDPNMGTPEVMPDFSAFDLSDHLESLEKFRNFLTENKELIKILTIVALGFLGALLLIKVVMGVLAVLSAPWLLLGVAIGAVIGLLWYIIAHWDEVVESFKKGLAWLGQLFADIWDGIKTAFSNTWNFIKDTNMATLAWIGDRWEAFKEMLDKIWDWLIEKWNNFTTFMRNVMESVVQWFINRWENIKTFFSGVGTFLRNVWTTVIDWMRTRIENIRTVFTNAWNWMKTLGSSVWEGIRNTFSTVINFMSNALTNVRTTFSNIFTTLGNVFKNVWESIKTTFSNVWNWILGRFNVGGSIFSGISAGILGVFKTVVNGLIRGINTVIGAPFRLINSTLNSIRSISILGAKPFQNFWGYNPIGVPRLPMLASGGVIDRPTVAMIGEGRYTEAVVPLGASPQFASMKQDIAEAVAQEIGNLMSGGDSEVILQIDGERIGKTVIKNINKLQRKSGTTLLKV